MRRIPLAFLSIRTRRSFQDSTQKKIPLESYPRTSEELCMNALFFNWRGRCYALNLLELQAASHSCAYMEYEGLPRGIRGIVQWSGKIFPVLCLAEALSSQKMVNSKKHLNKSASFIFTQNMLTQPYAEIAIEIPDGSKVNACELVDASTVKDTEGNEAQLLDLKKLLSSFN